MDREDEEHHEARGWGESSSSRPEAAGLELRVGLATWSAAARVRGMRGGRGQAGGGRAFPVASRCCASALCAVLPREDCSLVGGGAWEVNTGRSEFWSPVFRSTYLLTYVFAVGCEDKPPFVESTRDNRLFDCS